MKRLNVFIAKLLQKKKKTTTTGHFDLLTHLRVKNMENEVIQHGKHDLNALNRAKGYN